MAIEMKGRKVSNFHINLVRENLEKVLSGELNNKELMELINRQAQEQGQAIIKDTATIKKIVQKILANEPEKLKQYEEVLKHNPTKRRPKKIRTKVRISAEEKIKNEYLSKFLAREIHIQQIAEEMKMNKKTIASILKDLVGQDEYNKIIISNRGISVDRKKEVKIKREKALKANIVSNKEFLELSPEEQEEQIIKKMQQSQAKEATNNKSALTSEEYIKQRMQYIKDYFSEKAEMITELDIRYLVFRFPSVLRYSHENIDEKIKVLTNCEEIGEKNTYNMIKTFPGILGYSHERLSEQLQILKQEGLIYSFISRPIRFMQSPALIHALIQYAKERNNTSDLSKVRANNIFMANSKLKRLYGITHEELKAKYPYSTNIQESEEQEIMDITGQDIGRATFDVETKKCDEADKILKMLEKEKLRGETDGRDGV